MQVIHFPNLEPSTWINDQKGPADTVIPRKVHPLGKRLMILEPLAK